MVAVRRFGMSGVDGAGHHMIEEEKSRHTTRESRRSTRMSTSTQSPVVGPVQSLPLQNHRSEVANCRATPAWLLIALAAFVWKSSIHLNCIATASPYPACGIH